MQGTNNAKAGQGHPPTARRFGVVGARDSVDAGAANGFGGSGMHHAWPASHIESGSVSARIGSAVTGFLVTYLFMLMIATVVLCAELHHG